MCKSGVEWPIGIGPPTPTPLALSSSLLLLSFASRNETASCLLAPAALLQCYCRCCFHVSHFEIAVVYETQIPAIHSEIGFDFCSSLLAVELRADISRVVLRRLVTSEALSVLQ